jgi:hypothetical protein
VKNPLIYVVSLGSKVHKINHKLVKAKFDFNRLNWGFAFIGSLECANRALLEYLFNLRLSDAIV